MKSLGINKTGNDSASEHARTYEVRPTQVKKQQQQKTKNKNKNPSRFKQFVLFVLV